MDTEIKTGDTQRPDIEIGSFESPLDLLDHLLVRANVDLNKISIAAITDQYLIEIKSLPRYDMELVSSFLLMAATLIQIKSNLLLPQPRQSLYDSEDPDAGDELVFRLLRYRRCRLIALQLKDRHSIYADSFYKPEELPERLGIDIELERISLKSDSFLAAVDAIIARNSARFQSEKSSMLQIMQRERVSVEDCMDRMMNKLTNKAHCFFYEIFSPEESREVRIAGFLAVLELLRRNKIKAEQKYGFAPISIELKEQIIDG